MALNTTLRAGIERPKELVLPSPASIPRTFGHNWEDTAFKGTHHRKQVLESEAMGKVPPKYTKSFVRDHGEAPNFQESTMVLQQRLAERTNSTSLNGSLSGASAIAAAMSDPTMQATVDDYVLRFNAYFVEECRESAVERRRTRKVTIKAFPSDDTFLIEERRVANSGLQGGTLLKRQRVPVLSSPTEAYVPALSLNVGQDITLYGTVYHIFACDEATRRFLTAAGTTVGTNGPEPDDYYMTGYRAERIEGRRSGPTFESRDLSITMESLGSKGKSAASRYPDDLIRCKRFFEESGKVARFNAYWIDYEVEPKGRLRIFDLRCFVEDETISITERRVEGAPSDAIAKCFLSRRRLPKSGSSAQAVSLTFSGRINGQRDAMLGEADSYYSLPDLTIGGHVNAFGRDFVLYDCDAFTRDFYYNELRIPQQDAIDISASFPKPLVRPTIVPPPNGFGTPEDSLASCKSLVLKPPRKDTSGWLEFGGELLRFELKLLPKADDPSIDLTRQFVLTYYLEDNEIMISESAVRNSGFTGGKFLRKQKVRKAPGEGKASFYSLEDLQIGNVIDVNGFKFEVLRADEHTLTFLQSITGKSSSPSSSSKPAEPVPAQRVQQLITALKDFVQVRFCTVTEAFRSFDKDKDGYICAEELRHVLNANQITRKTEEADALAAALDLRGEGKISYATFVEAIGRGRPSSSQTSAAVASNVQTAIFANERAAFENTRQKALLALRGKLEARCMTNFEMFRMFAVLPRENRTQSAFSSAASLANGTKDTVMTPSQMRKGITSILGLMLSDSEMAAVLTSIFPALAPEQVGTPVETSTAVAITVNEFSQRIVEINALKQLPPR